MNKYNPLGQDLDHILEHTESIWTSLRGKRIFVTGGTGFFGKWLLKSFHWANDKLNLNSRMVVLSRDPGKFFKKYPDFSNINCILFHKGDVRDFTFPSEDFDCVIHGATDTTTPLKEQDKLDIFDTIVGGTRKTLDFSVHCNAERFLFLSSGAVYGQQPLEMASIPEDYCGAPDPDKPHSAYGEGKRAAELLCTLYLAKYGIETKVARCFAFVGPYLDLDAYYAIGNFIRDGLEGKPIVVSGDGTPFRSYLYAADLTIWLWKILLDGKPGEAYNVGSEDAVTIKDLAHTVANSFKVTPEVQIRKSPIKGRPPERYIPSTRKAFENLGLDSWITLEESIDRTIYWNQNQGYRCI
jgi:dTDP-glucose 4,6-dehydratase